MIGRVTRVEAVKGSSFPPHPAENSPCETQTAPKIWLLPRVCCQVMLWSGPLCPAPTPPQFHLKHSETEPSLKLRATVRRNVW